MLLYGLSAALWLGYNSILLQRDSEGRCSGIARCLVCPLAMARVLPSPFVPRSRRPTMINGSLLVEGIRLFTVTCLQFGGADVTLRILGVQAEDDKDS